MGMVYEEHERRKNCGFGKEKRITDNKEIKKVLRKGYTFSGAFLNIYFLPGKKQRFIIRLQHKVKGGYRRNRLRRRLREITRKAAGELKNGLYIVWGRKVALEVAHKRLKEDFEKVVREGNLWIK